MTDHIAYAVPDPMIGERIGRYVVQRKLAEGGMGAVYIATHERLENVTKVVKTMLPAYAANPMLRDRFEREALAVSRLRHRNIIQIDDFGQLPGGQLFLMMPFLDGRPLDALLQAQGKLTEQQALHILVQVCNALQYMHDTGLVHRDIKPSNIFLVEEDNNPIHVYLIDLGIAKSMAQRDAVTLTGAAMGTPAYMAVEQYENASAVTPLADLYAVAIVAWEMITGGLPWGMHSTHVLYKKQLEERPVRPETMRAAWYETLLSALSPHPSARPQSMRALAGSLAQPVPGGIEILERFARTLVHRSPPDLKTLRGSSRGALGAGPYVPPGASPALAGFPGVTTLTESSGVASPRPIPRTRRGPLAAMATLGVLIAVAAATSLALRSRAYDAHDEHTIGTSQPAITHASQPDAAAGQEPVDAAIVVDSRPAAQPSDMPPAQPPVPPRQPQVSPAPIRRVSRPITPGDVSKTTSHSNEQPPRPIPAPKKKINPDAAGGEEEVP